MSDILLLLDFDLNEDSGTVSLNLTVSGVDEYTGSSGSSYIDTATVRLSFTPSGTDIRTITEAATAVLKLTPSGTDIYEGAEVFTDSGIVRLNFTATSVEEFSGTTPTVGEPPWSTPTGTVIAALLPYEPWKIVHRDADGNELGEVTPESFRFGMFLSKPGYINYDMDMSNHMSSEDYVKPYFTDWELRRGRNIVKDMAGMHTEISVGEEETTFISIAGQTWLHYFERRYWPFNNSNPLAYPYGVAGRDLFLILDDILDVVLAQPDSLSFTYNFGTCGQTTNYKIEPGDSEQILSKFDSLAKLDPGFDYEITHDRIIKAYAPKKGNTLNLAFELHRNVELISYVDRGSVPVLFGWGSVGSQRAGFVSSTAGRRRYEESKDYGEVASVAALQESVEADQSRLLATNITFSVRWTGRDDDDDLLDQVDIGDTAPVYGDTGFAIIDGEYRIVGIEGEVSDEGNADYTVTFDDGTLSL